MDDLGGVSSSLLKTPDVENARSLLHQNSFHFVAEGREKMSKMMVNGVDISMLEGWMIKINSNPSFFGKNMNRRWFKVGFVPGPGSQEKLIISYATSKTAKEPRGWLYVEDVSGIYCRREMIEIVAPSRTLRLKGETAVEHRLWSDNSGDDSSEDDRDSPRPSTNSSSRSLLVAQIKSGSSCEALEVAQSKNVMSDSEEEDDNYHYERKQDPAEESPREPVTSSTSPIEDDVREELQKLNLQRTVDSQPSKRKNSEYFDSDEELEPSAPLSKFKSPVETGKASISSVTADNNFAHDDWDEEPSAPAPTKGSYPTALSHGVAADANFVHDDWDD
eukprot:jgi/Phyca11/529657/estExt2_fgenesh1_pm.C_PHYCAscaffold_470035